MLNFSLNSHKEKNKKWPVLKNKKLASCLHSSTKRPNQANILQSCHHVWKSTEMFPKLDWFCRKHETVKSLSSVKSSSAVFGNCIPTSLIEYRPHTNTWLSSFLCSSAFGWTLNVTFSSLCSYCQGFTLFLHLHFMVSATSNVFQSTAWVLGTSLRPLWPIVPHSRWSAQETRKQCYSSQWIRKR